MSIPKFNQKRNHQDAILTVSAIFLLVFLLSLFIWGIRVIASNLDRSLRVTTGGDAGVQAKIEQAKIILENRK